MTVIARGMKAPCTMLYQVVITILVASDLTGSPRILPGVSAMQTEPEMKNLG